ncbi:MAG: OmpA family protein [Haliscomenobacter sp.]|uniref:OmpA family protein n=1 Tax=Haliscomenobacter sp. TaxID=2717303 RepID=UPI0029A5A939|nr:OmpA family protein [Haliscomenobacter sp.]MDX2072598.1 OmpA family protein [Haliscomenobacter sp.]
MTHKLILSFLFLYASFFTLLAQSTEDLGRTTPFLVGFKGTIYEFRIPLDKQGLFDPKKVHYTPEIEQTEPIGYVYTQKLFITERLLDMPFPGVPKNKKVFAIIYTGRFEVKNTGLYEFLLQSDDGSRLWIDSTEVINRDGLRQFKEMKQGKIQLSSGFHNIKVWYFQGFPDRMGLKLMYKKAEEKAFQPFDFKPMEDEAKQYMQMEGETMKVRFAEKLSFETGEFALKPEADSILANVIRILNYNPGLKCRVEGHTDNVGSAKDNQVLAQNRAEAVAKALKAMGLPDSVKISVQSFGLSKPIAPNTTEAGRAQNRRVDVVMEW